MQAPKISEMISSHIDDQDEPSLECDSRNLWFKKLQGTII